MQRKTNNWIFAALLTLPILIVFLAYALHHAPGLMPTGFFQFDNVSYIAYARQYLDASAPHLFYANPCHDQESTPIYFQPQTLLFALLLRLGIAPGMILIPFTLICAWICFRLIIALHDQLLPGAQHRTRNIILFSWGGGLLVLAGVIFHFIQPASDLLNDAFAIDPEHGWWGLNLGRSLFFSCEAYYHAVFLGAILSLLQRRWLMGLVLVFLLSLSHPFTGIELSGIVLAWCAWEKVRKNLLPPWWFVAGVAMVCVFHAGFYLVYLEQFPIHRSVREQYSLTWRLSVYRMLPAYALCGYLTFMAIRDRGLKQFFNRESNRLFLAWFTVAFLLANHDLFIEARQPIHFTRGYIWTSLFLMGLPALDQLQTRLKTNFRTGMTVILMMIFLADNFFWITDYVRSKATETSPSYINHKQSEAIEWINENADAGTLLVCPDPAIAMMATVRSRAYVWYSHPYTTPYAESKLRIQQDFFQQGIWPSAWNGRRILFVIPATMKSFAHENDSLVKVYRIPD